MQSNTDSTHLQTSRQNPSPGLSLQPLRLDRIEFKGPFKIDGPIHYPSISVPSHLSGLLGDSLEVTPRGYLTPPGKKGLYGMNGADLVRHFLEHPTPKTEKRLRNQLSDVELLGNASEYTADKQLVLWEKVFVGLAATVRNEYEDQATLQRNLLFPTVEFHREHYMPANRDEYLDFFGKCICELYGAPVEDKQQLTKITRRKNARSEFYTLWQISSGSRGKGTFLKAYEKGNRMRLEVVFVGYRSDSLDNSLFEWNERAEALIRSAKDFLLSCKREAEEHLSKVIAKLGDAIPVFDYDSFYKKLHEFGVKSPKNNLRIIHMAKCIDKQGVYEPAAAAKDKRVNPKSMARLCGSNKVFIKHTEYGPTRKPWRIHYRLNPNWRNASPFTATTDSGNSVIPLREAYRKSNSLYVAAMKSRATVWDLDNCDTDMMIWPDWPTTLSK